MGEGSMTDNEAELFRRITFLKEEIQNLKKDLTQETADSLRMFDYFEKEIGSLKEKVA